MIKLTRRKFNSAMSKGIGGALLFSGSPLLYGKTLNGNQDKKLGVALVGLGGYSTYQLAPALLETSFCKLTGIVTGTPEKESIWAEKYGIPKKNIYNYDNFDAIKDNDEIDIVYVVLPNAMHAEFSIRAAKAGKHVICEKPMAINVAECDAIIKACDEAGVKLGIGYRLHSEPYTQEVKRIVKEKVYGDILYVNAEAAYNSRGNPEQWRLNKKLAGGGALMNMGVYSIQSAIYGTGQNPISVVAQEFSTRPDYFKDTDETITAQLELNPANNYGPLHGRTSDGKEINFLHERQQKLQMDDFAKHILQGTTNLAPGEMGKRDMIIVEAIYKSIAEGGKKIPLNLSHMVL